MIQLASSYGRYGYRKVTALLREEGWWVNHKRIERLWRQEGLKVPQKQPKRRCLWLNDGSCVRLRPTHKDHVWSYDFVADRTSDGRAFRMLTLIDEHTRECLAIDVARKLKSEDVLERLSDLLVRRGVPKYIRSDNGPEFTAKKVREWLTKVGVKTLFIEPGSPWENGYCESFNGRLRDELLAREQFDTLLEAKVLIERWRRHYNTVRPHGSLGYRPPAPEATQPLHWRVGPGDCSPRPLTEPDLWTAHPALQAVVSSIKQSLLFDGDPLRRIQRVPLVGEHYQLRGEPGVRIRLMDAGTDAAAPNAGALIGGVSRRPRRNIAGNQMAVKMPRPLLLTNDNRPKPTPDMGIGFV